VGQASALANLGVEPVTVGLMPIVAFDKHTSYIHHIPTDYCLSNKRIVLIDVGAKVEHYNADMTRTYVFDTAYSQPYEDVAYALRVLEDEAREGVNILYLVELAKKLLRKYRRCSFAYHHLLGHGIGLEVHELPNFRDNMILKKNMVLTFEPAIYVKNRFGIRLENTYVVKKKKIKSLC